MRRPPAARCRSTRVIEQEQGECKTMFAARADLENDPFDAIDALIAAYPQIAELVVSPIDEAWFTTLVREYPKPMPFVAAIGGALPLNLAPSRSAPDALVGPAWRTIYAALGSVMVGGYPVIEGLLNAVHLDHLIELDITEDELLGHTGEQITLYGGAEQYADSASGRVVTIHVEHRLADGALVARET